MMCSLALTVALNKDPRAHVNTQDKRSKKKAKREQKKRRDSIVESAVVRLDADDVEQAADIADISRKVLPYLHISCTYFGVVCLVS